MSAEIDAEKVAGLVHEIRTAFSQSNTNARGETVVDAVTYLAEVLEAQAKRIADLELRIRQAAEPS